MEDKECYQLTEEEVRRAGELVAETNDAIWTGLKDKKLEPNKELFLAIIENMQYLKPNQLALVGATYMLALNDAEEGSSNIIRSTAVAVALELKEERMKRRVKSLEWYNENKDNEGDVAGTGDVFTKRMSKYCGQEIELIQDEEGVLHHGDWRFEEWMLEPLEQASTDTKEEIR